MNRSFFKIIHFLSFGDFNEICHLVALEDIGKRHFEKFEFELVIIRFRPKSVWKRKIKYVLTKKFEKVPLF
jgi:hypothetical protein